MPTYDFRCQHCGKVFEETLSISDYEHKQQEGWQCQACGSTDVVQQISSFQVKTGKKS